MKSTMKKGFTLVELLFVMAIISILAGFAIANLNDSTKVAVANSMKSDARGAIIAQQTEFANAQAYTAISCGETGSDTKNNGLCTTGNVRTAFSKGNTITVATKTCTDGSAGYTVALANATYTSEKVEFDSCLDGSLVINAAAPAVPGN